MKPKHHIFNKWRKKLIFFLNSNGEK